MKNLQEFVGLDLSPEQGTLEDLALRKTQDSACHSSLPGRSGQGIVTEKINHPIEYIIFREQSSLENDNQSGVSATIIITPYGTLLHLLIETE